MPYIAPRSSNFHQNQTGLNATMETIQYLGILLLVTLVALAVGRRRRKATGKESSGKPASQPAVRFHYRRKTYMMTRAENEFFDLLVQTLEPNYFVFPQMHLSSILDHTVKAQNWEHALRYINQKSVDYVICDRVLRKPLVAIELDDWSHNSDSRKQRDANVENIFNEAGIPLLRFKDVHTMSRGDIEARLKEALSQTEIDT